MKRDSRVFGKHKLPRGIRASTRAKGARNTQSPGLAWCVRAYRCTCTVCTPWCTRWGNMFISLICTRACNTRLACAPRIPRTLSYFLCCSILVQYFEVGIVSDCLLAHCRWNCSYVEDYSLSIQASRRKKGFLRSCSVVLTAQPCLGTEMPAAVWK